MNEQALVQLYSLAQNDGYQKTFEEFKGLMSESNEAVQRMYGLAQGDGYSKNIEDFYTLVGLKKKVQSDSISPKDVMESTTEDENQSFLSDFIEKDETNAKPLLQDKLKSKGYSVEETGFGDALLVTDNVTGDEIDIDLQPFTEDGKKSEMDKVQSLLEKSSDPKRALLSTNNKEDFTRDVDSYIQSLRNKLPNFAIEYIDDENIRITKGEQSQEFKVKTPWMNDRYGNTTSIKANEESFKEINQFIYNNTTEEEASVINENLGLDTATLVEEGLKNIESTVDVSFEASERDLYNRDYFKGLFDFLESNNVPVPEESRKELERGTNKEMIMSTRGNFIPRYTPFSRDQIKNGIEKYFGDNPEALKMIDAYDLSGIISNRKEKIDRAKKLKTEIFYENLPNREEVKEVLRQQNQKLSEEELDIKANIDLAQKDVVKIYGDLAKNIKEIKENNPDAKLTPLYDSNNMLIDITSDKPIKELDDLNKKVRESFKNYEELYKVSKYRLDKIAAKKETSDEFMEAGKRNYDLVDNAMADLKNAVVQMGGGLAIVQGLAMEAVDDVTGLPISATIGRGVPASMGVDIIRGEMKESREDVENFYRTKRTYQEAYKEGRAGTFAVRTFAEQFPNIALAIGTSGAGNAVGLSEAAVSTLVATEFGLTSAGQKYDELTTRQEFGKIAKKGLKELESLKGIIPDEEYFSQKYELERAVKDSEISSAQKTAAVVGTGLVEGLVTRFIGTVPNSIKVLKDIKTGPGKFMDDILMSNYKAAGKTLKEFGKRTGGEVIEEGSIDVLSQINNYAFLGDQIDLSSLDDVAVTSIITSGTMNTPSMAYSTILKQVNVNRYKNAIRSRTNEISTLKDLLRNPELTDIQRNNIHNSISNSISAIADETTAMEGDAMLLGADGIKEMLTLNGVKDSMLKKADVEFDDSYEIARTKIDNYISSLSESEGKAYIDQMKYVDDKRSELIGTIKYEGAVAKVFGEKGKEIANNLNPNLSPKEKYVEVYKQVKQEINDNAKKEFESILKEQTKVTPEQETEIEDLRQQEIEEVELAIARSSETGETTDFTTETITEINEKYDTLLKSDKQKAKYVVDLIKTKKSNPQTYWSVSEVTIEDASNSTLIDDEDGSAVVKPDGDISGLFKKPTSKNKGVAQKLLKKAVEAGGKKLDNFDGYLTKQYEKAGFRIVARTPFNENYSPDGWNQEMHGTPDVVAMVYDPQGKLNIEEKMFDNPDTGYDEMIAYRDKALETSQETTTVDDSEQTIDGVAKLREMFKSPDQKKQVDNALTALSNIAPDVEIILPDSEKAYAEATGEIGRNQKTSGTYEETIVDGKTRKVIYINPEKSNARTVAHEAFHAIFISKVKNDAESQRLTDAMIKAVYKSAPTELKNLIDDFATSKNADGSNNYDSSVQNEEKLAELIGYLATEYDSLPKPTKNVIKRFLDKLAKMFGMKPFTDTEVIDVLNTIAKKVSTGEAITDQDVSVLKGGKVVSNPIKLIERKSVGAFDVQYTEANKTQELKDKKLLVEVNDVSEFSDLQAAITSPDDMLAGTISIDGKQIFEGGGGIFFVTKYGDVWASGKKGTAKTLANMINNSLKNNKGRGLLVLTKGADQKLISSVSGVDSSLAVLDVMLEKGLVSPSDFRSSVSGAVKKAGGIIKLKGSAKQLRLDIKKYFSDPTTTTFEKRGNVVKDIIGRLAQSNSVKDNSIKIINLLGGDTNKRLGKGKTKIAQSLGDLVAGVAAEQLTKGLSVGDVYGIIEVNSEVEVIEDSHPSYPFHVRLKDGSKPKLILPKNRQNGSEVLKTSTGKVYKVGNVSVMSGSFNTDIKPTTISRKQATGRPTIDNVVRQGKNNNISDADIRQFAKEEGYSIASANRAIEAYNEEKRIAGQKGEKMFTGNGVISTFLDKNYRRLLSSKGFMPKSMHIGKEVMDGAIEANLKQAKQTIKDMQRFLKKFKGDENALIQDLDNYMRGNQDVDILPEKLQPIAFVMRTQIDSLSKQLIESGAVSDIKFDDLKPKQKEDLIERHGTEEEARKNYRSLQENILGNIGTYMTRSYEVFDNKDYKPTDEVMLSADNKLREIYLEEAIKTAEKENNNVSEVLDRLVTNKIESILTPEGATAFLTGSKLGSKKTSILKQKLDIPSEIRALMGEYTDPALNYAKSIQKMSALVANQQFLKKMKEAGQGVFFFTEEDLQQNPKLRKEFNTKIAAETSETMNPLSGLYTSENISEAMTNSPIISTQNPILNGAYNFWLKAVGTVKYNKTILSPGTHAKNIIGNLTFMAYNGYLSPKEYADAFNVIMTDLRNLPKEQQRAKLQEYIKAGIINQSATLGDIRAIFESKDSVEDMLIKRMSDPKQSLVTKAKIGLKKAGKAAEAAYQAEDDFFKIVAYENEKKRYAKAFFKKDFNDLNNEQKKEINDYVSEVVKNILPNYSRIGDLGKMMKAIPVAGTFISFQLEAMRTAYNTVGLAFTEIKNEKTRAIGIKRLSGIMAVIGLKAAIIGSFGVDDEDDEIKDKARNVLPPWAKNANIAITELGDGKFKYINFSASDPHGFIDKALISYMRGESFGDSMGAVATELIGPFFQKDILWNTLFNITENRDDYGREIWNESDSVDETFDKIGSRIWKTLEPGGVTSVKKIIYSETPMNEMIGQLTGYKEFEVDAPEKIGYISSDIKKRSSVSSKDYARAYYEYKDKKISKEELEERYNKANEKYKKIMEEGIELYKTGLILGVPDLKNRLSGFSKTEKEFISRGIVPEKSKRKEKQSEYLKMLKKMTR